MASNPKPQDMDAVLAAYRKSIDNIDAALIHMLAERFRITQAVGEYKAEAGLPASDPSREARQIERCARWRSRPTSTRSSARSSSAS
jgi:chorismate mutase